MRKKLPDLTVQAPQTKSRLIKVLSSIELCLYIKENLNNINMISEAKYKNNIVKLS